MSGGRQQRGGRACTATTKSFPRHMFRTMRLPRPPSLSPATLGCRSARALPSHSSGAFRCRPATNPAWHRASVQSTLSPGTKHGLTTPQPHPSMNELTYDTQRKKWQHCAAHTGFFNSPDSLSVQQIHYKLLEDRKFGFLIYFLTEGIQLLYRNFYDNRNKNHIMLK